MDTSNLLHQNYTEKDLAKDKVLIMEKRYAMNGINAFMKSDDFPKYDLIVSCVDNMAFRKALYEYCWANKKQFIDGRCTSRNGMVATDEVPKSDLEHFISDSEESGGCLLKFEKDNGICHSLPVVVASTMVQMFLNKTRGIATPYRKDINL